MIKKVGYRVDKQNFPIKNFKYSAQNVCAINSIYSLTVFVHFKFLIC